MRWLNLTFAALVAVTLPVGATAQSTTEDVLLAERVSLKNAPARSIDRIVPKRAATTPVSFTRRWLAAQPKATGGEDWKCLSQALYFEARGESVKGQFAVAEVILNRVKSSRFPDTVCGVIRQGTGRKYQCQFTYTCDGNSERIREPGAYQSVGKVARTALDGRVDGFTGGATHYHTTAVRPKWSRVYKRTARIGVHLFYRHNYREAKK